MVVLKHTNFEGENDEKEVPSPTFKDVYFQCHPRYIVSAIKTFFKKLPGQIWKFYITALLIPNYRAEEWGKYSRWQYDAEGNSAKLRKTNTSRRVENKYHHSHEECQRVFINISGQIFETQLRTLNKFPDSLLGNSLRRLPYFDPVRQQYFFDRHASSFEGIFHYYQSGGTLRRPVSVSMEVFYEEARFFDISEIAIQKLRHEEGYGVVEATPVLTGCLFGRKIWLLLEYPESSFQARLVTILSVYVIILSIVIFCLETVDSLSYSSKIKRYALVNKLNDPFYFVETICICWFTLEYLLRLFSCPDKGDFLTSVKNMLDVISILPYFIQIAMYDEENPENTNTSLAFLRILRLIRVFRILKLSRHSKGLQILGLALKASVRELGLLMFFLVIGVILFSSAMYFAEMNARPPGKPQNYKSIPDAFWWGVITMTTVGYGDSKPEGDFGRVVGSLCAIAGVLCIALPVPVIVSNFNYFYHRETEHPGELEGVNLNEVEMCPFRPGNYKPADFQDFEYSSSDSSYDNLKHVKYQRRLSSFAREAVQIQRQKNLDKRKKGVADTGSGNLSMLFREEENSSSGLNQNSVRESEPAVESKSGQTQSQKIKMLEKNIVKLNQNQGQSQITSTTTRHTNQNKPGQTKSPNRNQNQVKPQTQKEELKQVQQDVKNLLSSIDFVAAKTHSQTQKEMAQETQALALPKSAESNGKTSVDPKTFELHYQPIEAPPPAQIRLESALANRHHQVEQQQQKRTSLQPRKPGQIPRHN